MQPNTVTERSSFCDLAREAPPGARIPVEVRVPVADPFDAYRRARDGADGVFLETGGGQGGWGFFAVDPVERARVAPEAVALEDDSPTLAALDGLLDGETLVRGDCEVPFPCGLFGWLSYDVARELEALPTLATTDPGLPRLQVALYDRVAAWEEPRGESTTLRITACPRVGGGSAGKPDHGATYERALARAADLAVAARVGDPSAGPPPVESGTATFESACGRAAFVERVARVKARIRAGETFQANVSQRLVAPAAVHPVEAYAALRRVNPAPYAALLEFPGVDLVGASPELLVRVEGDRVETEPIAGTRPRGETPAADEALEADLRTDGKERAEHAMLVDLERNDLGKVCEYGSVEVSEYRRIDRYSAVMHLVSKVEGRLREDAGAVDAVAATFPGGTITGAPKPRTMEIIEAVEPTRRGPYTGSVGVFGFDGRATRNIIIRTLVRRGDEYRLRVGAGIVHDSVADREYDETLDKARALLAAVDEALDAEASLAVVDAAADGSGTHSASADPERSAPSGSKEGANAE
ncbi:MAG: aminodeoxychorismate synthase, component I [Salinigranum sp.]